MSPLLAAALAAVAACGPADLPTQNAALVRHDEAPAAVKPATVDMTLQLQATTITIGSGVLYTATITNTGGRMNNVFVQGELLQGTGVDEVIRGAGGTYLTCAAIGVLPKGVCTVNFGVTAPSDAPFLHPGGATFRLQLLQDVGNRVNLLDEVSIAVTLVAAT